jgi:hypothetical protein
MTNFKYVGMTVTKITLTNKLRADQICEMLATNEFKNLFSSLCCFKRKQ